MSDPTVEKWNQKGQIWIWRFAGRSKHFEGLYATADSVGCKSLRELFKLMNNAQWPSSKILKISKNAFIDTTGSGYNLSLLNTLKIKFRKDQVPEDHWNMEWDSSRKNYTLSIGEKKFKELDNGISDIEKGHGDYAIGPVNEKRWDEMCLWFWWHVKKK
jgi:hypothetical protein